MKRRDFFKVLGGAALAMVGVRAAKARVCERNVGTLRAIYPVGAIYISTTNVDPADLFGFGTWQRFGNGRTLVSVDEGVTANIPGEAFGRLNQVQLTGGRNTHTLTTGQMPSHNHPFTNATGTIPRNLSGAGSGVFSGSGWASNYGAGTTNHGGFHDTIFSLSDGGFAINNSGGGAAHNNLPPYITVFMWRRSA